MPTSSPNSKRCFARELAAATLAAAALTLASPSPGWSAVSRAPASIEAELSRDLASPKARGSFAALLRDWEDRYQSDALDPLLRIASSSSRADADRYVALMAAAKIGGTGAVPRLTPFLKSPSWMLRSGALRALSAIGVDSVGPSILPLLEDPALVVRTEAVEAVDRLRPSGAVPALLRALRSGANYHGGKALWVPQKAISALVAMSSPGTPGALSIASELKPLLRHDRDPELQSHTVQALEALTGRRIASVHRSLRERIRAAATL
jgi:HEAT repeat protein